MKTNILRILFICLLCATFFAIFRFSAQNGVESSSLSQKVTVKFVNIFPYTKNLSAETKAKLVAHGEIIVRKIAHFSIYTLVGIFIMAFMSTFNTKLKIQFGVSILVGLIYAITDEYHQSFIPGRGPSAIDVCIDTCGVIFGILIVLAIISIYRAFKYDEKIRRDKSVSSNKIA